METSLINLEDIRSLTDFQRDTKSHLKRLKKTGRPQILTVNGKAEVVVQDANSYQKLLERLDREEAIAGIRRGLDSVARGEGQPLAKALAQIRAKHKIPMK